MLKSNEKEAAIITVIETADGSHTLYNASLDETFHSRKGAVTESRHVFIKEGMDFLASSTLRVLEIGFGTGLNAILALENAGITNRQVRYVTLEPFPLAPELITKLNYEVFLAPSLHTHFKALHNAPWGQSVSLDTSFELCKVLLKLEEYQAENNSYNLIFFDAFAPQKQPDMWVEEHFLKLYQMLESGGILVSYCASGQFKRNLQSAGFMVTKLPGPPGKKEMIRACKP